MSLFASVLATFAVAGTALKLHQVARQKLAGKSLRDHMRQLLWLPLLGLAFLAAWWFDQGDCWGFFGVAALYLGFGLIVEKLREQPGVARRCSRWAW